MPTTYSDCPQAVEDLAKKIMRGSHNDLLEADVTINFVFARSHDSPPIMHNGWPAKAKVKINSYLDRVEGKKDATITIDEQQWQEEWDDNQKVSLLDHELQHLEVCRNKIGGIKYDDANRPRLRIRKHDFQIGGFHSIVRRWGKDAHEAVSIFETVKHWRQQEFDWEGAEVEETTG